MHLRKQLLQSTKLELAVRNLVINLLFYLAGSSTRGFISQFQTTLVLCENNHIAVRGSCLNLDFIPMCCNNNVDYMLIALLA